MLANKPRFEVFNAVMQCSSIRYFFVSFPALKNMYPLAF